MNDKLKKRETYKKIDINSFKDKSIDEIIEEINIYHQELEFQNLELVRIQEQLFQSKNYLNELFENAPVGYVIFDSQLFIHSANTKFCEYTKASKDHIINEKITKFIHPNFQDSFYLYLKRIIKSNTTESIELKLHTTNIYINASCNISIEGKNNIIRMSLTDISELKKNRIELEQTALKNSAILQALPDLIFVFNSNAEFIDYHTTPDFDTFILMNFQLIDK